MNTHIDYRKGVYGREIELDEPKWRAFSFGISNVPRRGTLDYETLEDLNHAAEQIDYSSELSEAEKLLSRFYGGEIETSHGNIEWLGQMPEDVQQYIEKVEEKIFGKTKKEEARQIGRGVLREII